MKKDLELKLNKIWKKYPISTAYLFGSQANGKAGVLSDFDFAVQLNNTVKEKDFFDCQLKIMSELVKIFNKQHVDLIILNSQKNSLLLKYNIIKDGKIIYCADQESKNELEATVIHRFLDWKYFEEIYHQIFISKLANEKI